MEKRLQMTTTKTSEKNDQLETDGKDYQKIFLLLVLEKKGQAQGWISTSKKGRTILGAALLKVSLKY